MALLAAFLKADRLAAFRADGATQAVAGATHTSLAILEISLLKHARDGIGDGQNQVAVLENGMLPADALELIDDFAHIHT